jgi:pyruvate ferredoxin oxidoreductase beta subunit/phenylglyoxylate dehydrogenase beta subunit
MAMHDIPYVATATLSHLEDYAKKLVKAKEAAKHGFAYIHVFCPCVVGWRIPVDASIQVCRDAVRTNYFPLWEMEGGAFRITQKVSNPKLVGELTSTLGKFRHMKPEELAVLQGQVDQRFRVLQALCAGSAAAEAPAAK